MGKLDFDPTVIEDLGSMGIDLLLPEANTLDVYRIYNAANRDPFENALITVALTKDCTLVTSENNLLQTKFQDLRLMNASQ